MNVKAESVVPPIDEGWRTIEQGGLRFRAPGSTVETPALTAVWGLRQYEDIKRGLIISTYRRESPLSGSLALEGLARAAMDETPAEEFVVMATADRWELLVHTTAGDETMTRIVAMHRSDGYVTIVEIAHPASLGLESISAEIASSIELVE